MDTNWGLLGGELSYAYEVPWTERALAQAKWQLNNDQCYIGSLCDEIYYE